MITELRNGVRHLRRKPAPALFMMLTLALGLGMATAGFSLLYGVLLRPLAFPHSEQLFTIHGRTPDGFKYYPRWRELSAIRHLPHVKGATGSRSLQMWPVLVKTGQQSAVMFTMGTVAQGSFRALGIKPRLGRTPDATEFQHFSPVALLSHGVWKDGFHGDPHVIGTTFAIQQQVFTIIGVLPRGVQFGTYGVVTPYQVGQTDNGCDILLRVPLHRKAAVEQELNALIAHTENRTGLKLSLQSLRSTLTAPVRTPIHLVALACGLVLLICLLSAATLQRGQAASRAQELAIRSALGGCRSAVATQLGIESLMVALAGAALGLLLAHEFLRTALTFWSIPREHNVSINPAALAATATLAVVAMLVSGLLPMADVLLSERPYHVLQRTGRQGFRWRAERMLLTGEVALAFILLFTAGLFYRSFHSLKASPVGLNPRHLVLGSWTLGLPPLRAATLARPLLDRAATQLSALPGVHYVSFAQSAPLLADGFVVYANLRLPDHPLPRGDHGQIQLQAVGASLAHAFGVPLLAGRDLTRSDGQVCLVNHLLAVKYFSGDKQALDHSLPPNLVRNMESACRIVGVLQDMPGMNLGEKALPQVYFPYFQIPADSFLARYGYAEHTMVLVRATQPKSAMAGMRSVLKEIDPQGQVTLSRMEDVILHQPVLREQLRLVQLGLLLSSAALLLALAGIYGFVVGSGRRRRREFGIRIAAGASRARLLRLLLAQSTAIILAGVVLGAVLTHFLAQLLRTFLFHIVADDPITYAAVTTGLVLLSLTALLLPASRAIRVSASELLRSE